VTSDAEPAAANNPAGRVLAFLQEFQATIPRVAHDNAMLVMTKMLDEPRESARIYLAGAQLRVQAESVPPLMAPYESNTHGYRRFVQHYPQIIQSTKMLSMPHQYSGSNIFEGVTDGGWIALELADEVLRSCAAEPSLTKGQEADHLGRIRALIDEVVADDGLSAADRARVVDLLRKVEQALLDIMINGALPVQDAAAAAVLLALRVSGRRCGRGRGSKASRGSRWNRPSRADHGQRAQHRRLGPEGDWELMASRVCWYRTTGHI